MAMLRRRGQMTAVVCSEAFVKLARNQAKALGVPELPLIVISHPVGGISLAEVHSRVAQAFPQLEKLLQDFTK